jgi:hypothetical protein
MFLIVITWLVHALLLTYSNPPELILRIMDLAELIQMVRLFGLFDVFFLKSIQIYALVVILMFTINI